jgi:hypothetical protein
MMAIQKRVVLRAISIVAIVYVLFWVGLASLTGKFAVVESVFFFGLFAVMPLVALVAVWFLPLGLPWLLPVGTLLLLGAYVAIHRATLSPKAKFAMYVFLTMLWIVFGSYCTSLTAPI